MLREYIDRRGVGGGKIPKRDFTTDYALPQLKSTGGSMLDMSDLIVGSIFTVYYSEGNINNMKYELRAVVDFEHYVLRSDSPVGFVYIIRDKHWFEARQDSITIETSYNCTS